MTPELAEQRLGKLCASEAAVIMGGLTTDGLKKLIRRKAGERVFGDLGEEGFKSWAMERGSAEENFALDWVEFQTGWQVERQQHLTHPTIPYVAATPDGLMRGLRTVEAKSPLFHVWAETREAWQRSKRGFDAIPSEYRWQCRWQVWVCDVPAGIFVAYHAAGGGQGVIVPYEVERSDFDAMAERAQVVDGLIRNWVEILKG